MRPAGRVADAGQKGRVGGLQDGGTEDRWQELDLVTGEGRSASVHHRRLCSRWLLRCEDPVRDQLGGGGAKSRARDTESARAVLHRVAPRCTALRLVHCCPQPLPGPQVSHCRISDCLQSCLVPKARGSVVPSPLGLEWLRSFVRRTSPRTPKGGNSKPRLSGPGGGMEAAALSHSQQKALGEAEEGEGLPHCPPGETRARHGEPG